MFPVSDSLEDEWRNFEEELKASYQEFLFVRAHMSDQPKLYDHFNIDLHFTAEEMNNLSEDEIQTFFKENMVPSLLHSMMPNFVDMKNEHKNFESILESDKMKSLLQRVFHSSGPDLKIPKGEKAQHRSLIKTRENFKKEILDSMNGL